MTESAADLVILGGGSGGYSCAFRAAELGLSVVLIEEAELGGTCLHRGCIPTKALLHAAEVADNTRESQRFGIRSTFDGVDATAVLQYQESVVARLYKGLQGLVKARNVTFVPGTGTLTGPNTIKVGDDTYRGRHIVLATGSFPRGIPGLDIGGRIITSNEALRLDYVPARAIVLGGGVIGVEFASIWRSFGAEVTIVEALPRLIATEEDASSKALERAFRKRGITARTGVRFAAATQDQSGVHVRLEDGTTLDADVLLVAVGRGPRTQGLGYEESGVRLDRGFVVTDERLRTSAPGVYAVGDIVPGPQLAHRGFAHGIFVAEDIAGLNPRPIEDWTIPRVTYCEPEVASVGMTRVAAEAAFGPDAVVTYEYNLGGNGKSQILGTAGFVLLVQRKDGPVVGVHMVGSRMSEQVGEAQAIISWEAEPADVAAHIHAHPTQNEALGEAHLALAGKPLHVHG